MPGLIRFRMMVPITLTAFALAACGHPSWSGAQIGADGDGPAIRLQNGDVVIAPNARPEARVSAQGALSIGGKAVVVTPTQRAQLLAYHRDAFAVLRSGLAIGKAGATMAGSVVGSVIGHLADGGTRNIQYTADQQADRIRRQAAALCGQLEILRQAQDAVAADLPAFAPYAVLKPDAARDCRSAPHHG